MASWLSSWLTYYRRLWAAGAMVLIALGFSAFIAFLCAFAPLILLAEALGLGVDQSTVALVAGVAALPAALGGFLRYIPKAYGAPPRPPGWRDFKAGLPLPDYEPI